MNERKPLVSIITPCYNMEKFVADFLDSILNQTYDNLEVIIIDDGSSDNTNQILQSYSDRFKTKEFVYKIINQPNSGQASALNKGLSIFEGKYFTWPDADDILHKESIEKRVSFLEDNKDYSFVRSNGAYFRDNLKFTGRISHGRNNSNEIIFDDLYMERTYNSSGCYMMSKDLFEQCYPNKQIFAGLGSQNWQLQIPAASRSKCGYIDEDLYYVRVRNDSFCRKERSFNDWIDRFNDHHQLLVDAFRHSSCNFDKLLKDIDKRYLIKRLNLAINHENVEYLEKMYKNELNELVCLKIDKSIFLACKSSVFLKYLKIKLLIMRIIQKIDRDFKKLLRV